MHTIPISFCGGLAFHIADDLAKEDILRDVSDRLRVRTMIRDAKVYSPETGSLDTVGSYVVHLQSRGNPYLLFLNRVGFCETAMYVDRKVRPGYSLPRIIVDRVMFDPELFSETVVSGEMVRSADGEWRFLAEDVLAIKGTPVGRIPFRDRYAALLQIVSSHRTDDASTHKIVVKKMFEADCEGLAALQKHAASVPYAYTGYVFRSLIPGKRNWFVRLAASTTSTGTSGAEKSVKTMKIRSSVTPDVYDVADPASGRPCGVLGVSGLDVSKELSSAFADSIGRASRSWKCRWSCEFGKWMAVAGGGCAILDHE
jgi:hypothetical protein